MSLWKETQTEHFPYTKLKVRGREWERRKWSQVEEGKYSICSDKCIGRSSCSHLFLPILCCNLDSLTWFSIPHTKNHKGYIQQLPFRQISTWLLSLFSHFLTSSSLRSLIHWLFDWFYQWKTLSYPLFSSFRTIIPNPSWNVFENLLCFSLTMEELSHISRL